MCFAEIARTNHQVLWWLCIRVEGILVRITAANRGPDACELHPVANSMVPERLVVVDGMG
jgi:hypothetical protein